MKKNFFLLALSLSFLTSEAQAYIPASAYSQAKLWVYGMFTSSDPFCQKDFVETVKIKGSSPTEYDLKQKPSFGLGRLAMPLRCVVLIMRNSIAIVLPAGNYTTTTNGLSDSVCNAGRDRSGVLNDASDPIFWPAEISAALSREGIAHSGSLPATPTGQEVIPVYITSAARCYGNAGLDTVTPGCDPNTMVEWHRPPAYSGDSTRGVHFDPPARSSSHKFVMDINYEMGNDNGLGCGDFTPIFSFK